MILGEANAFYLPFISFYFCMFRKVLTFFGGGWYIFQTPNEGFLKELIFISFKGKMIDFELKCSF